MNALFHIEIGFLILIFNNALIQFSYHISMDVQHGGKGQGGGGGGYGGPLSPLSTYPGLSPHPKFVSVPPRTLLPHP